MKILVFSRGDFYPDIFDNSKFKNNYFVVTDAAYTFPTTRFDYCLAMASDKYAQKGRNFFSDSEMYNIIRRCRYLRIIPINKAVQYVTNATGQILKIFEDEKPDIVYAHIPDSYSMYILFKVAQRFGAKTCVINVHAIPGYLSYFDYNKYEFYYREKPLENFDLGMIYKEKYGKFPFYTVQPRGYLKELYARLRALPGALYVQTKFHNPFNFDVKNKNFYAMCCATRAIPLARFNFGDLNTKKYYSSLEDAQKISGGKKKVYISLHYYPEASIDYMSTSTSLIDHDAIVLEILNRYSDRYVFFLKEHPAMYNFRSLDFYEKIKKYPNTYLVHPAVGYDLILQESDFVVSWGGSIGIEAPFFGVYPINVIKPIYHIAGFDNYFADLNDLLENFSDKIDHPSYEISQYCQALNNLYSKILFSGDVIATMVNKNEDGLLELGRSVDMFLYDRVS